MISLSLNKFTFTRRLQIYLLIPVLLIILFAVGLAVAAASRSVNQLYDQQLKNNAEILLAFLHYELAEVEYEEESDEEADDDEEEFSDHLVELVAEIETERNLSVNYRFSIGDRLLFTSGLVNRFPACAEGFGDFDFISSPSAIGPSEQIPSEDWRCYRQTQILVGSEFPINVEFFEPHIERRRAVRSLILTTFSPIFLLPLIVLTATLWAVRRGLKPLHFVSTEISDRSVDNLRRISGKRIPAEFIPVVDSVNSLLAGVGQGILREKQFTDDAAHQLRTPITSIKMLEQLLRRDNADPKLVPHLNSLRDSVDQSNELIEQLLRFARLQSTQSLEMQSLDVESLLRTRLGLLSPLLTSKNLVVNFTVEALSPSIQANKPAMELLIDNLLSNAIKFSDNGGTLTLIVKTEAFRLEDDGPGIPTADRERVFNRFFRSASTSETYGSGLGLAIARWVADTHNFKLSVVDPEQGSGAAFLLEFNAV